MTVTGVKVHGEWRSLHEGWGVEVGSEVGSVVNSGLLGGCAVFEYYLTMGTHVSFIFRAYSGGLKLIFILLLS